MATNSKNEKFKNPIVLSACVLALSLLVSFIICFQTIIISNMAEEAYFKSETFMETLADLTVYLKQVKIEGIPLSYHKYENLYNLEYYIEGWNGSERRVISNADLKGEELEGKKKKSKFYMGITFSDAKNYSIEDSLDYASYGHEEFSKRAFQKRLNTIIHKGTVGREKEMLGYEQLRVYYFIPNGTLVSGDFIDTNVNKYKATARFKVTLVTHIIFIGICVVGLVVGCYRNLLEGEKWNRLRKVNLEFKMIGLILISMVMRNIYWYFRQPRAVIRIIDGNITMQLSWIGIYLLGGVFGLTLLVWYMTEISYWIRNGIVNVMKDESYIFRHREVIVLKVKKLQVKMYGLIGIDLKGRPYLKLMMFNGLHVAALIILARIAWSSASDALMVGMVYMGIGALVLLGLWIDFNHLKKCIARIKEQEILESVKSPLVKGVFILLGYCVGVSVLAVIGYESEIIGLLVAIVLGIIVVIGSIIWVKSYYSLYEYVVDINHHREGIRPASSFLSPIIDELNLIEEGLQSAVNKELISQRMKTELISNVSHDLKTPLTSIINYVDLLKDKTLSGEQQQEYIEILDRKSKRLKVLIEDLFEVSKTASGNIEVVKEKINLVALLNQTLGEMAEKISVSKLQFKVNVPGDKVICELDGRRTYRIFENLIENILKYSAPLSRVYIDCQVEEEIILTFKNISAYEMNFTAEDIMERFKRGDESRHTEGSGLGLAIAKNLTELQGGNFEVYIDGDLFKVVVKF